HGSGNAVEFEQDAARLHASGPEFRRTLTLTHADFGRLRRHGDVGKYADPQTALALDRAADRAACRLDLTRGDALGFERLQPVGAEVQRRTALGVAVDAALEGLAELGFFRLQHVSSP